MRRFAVALTMAVMTSSVLSACGGNDYCDVVKDNQKTLSTYGKTTTDAAYAKYAKVFDQVGLKAPKDVAADWKKLSQRADGVVKAQEAAGIKLEDMSDAKKTKKLESAQLDRLNKSYKAFNDTSKERAAVVKNVKQECKITLK